MSALCIWVGLAATAEIRKKFTTKIGSKNKVYFIYCIQKKDNIYQNGMVLGVLEYAESNGKVYFIEKFNYHGVIKVFMWIFCLQILCAII